MFADVRRGLTVAAVVEAATVTDTDGNVIDTSEFFGSADTEDELDAALAAAAAEVDEDDELDVDEDAADEDADEDAADEDAADEDADDK